MTRSAGAIPASTHVEFDHVDRRLLTEFQRDFPLTSRPYRELGARLGIPEKEVIERLAALSRLGCVSRVGPVFRPGRLGASTLAAMAVPGPDLPRIAALVSRYPEVNHNYEREHSVNLWFVVTAPTRARIDAVLAEIGASTGLDVLDLPLEEHFHIDLAFPLWQTCTAP